MFLVCCRALPLPSVTTAGTRCVWLTKEAELIDSKFIPITDCLVGSQSCTASTDQRLNRPLIAPLATHVLQQPGLQAGGLRGSLRVLGPGWRGCRAASGSGGQAGGRPFDLLCTPAGLSVTLESVQRLSQGSSFPGLRVSMRDLDMCVSTHQCMLEQEVRGGCSDEGKTSQLFMAVRAKKPRSAWLPLQDLALACAPCWWWASCGPAPCPHVVGPALREHLAHAFLAAEGELRDPPGPCLELALGHSHLHWPQQVV